MTLAKDFVAVQHPAVPGQPSRPARVECQTVAPPGTGTGGGGRYEERCSVVRFPVGSGYPTSMGQTVTVIGVVDGFVELRICQQVWVPND